MRCSTWLLFLILSITLLVSACGGSDSRNRVEEKANGTQFGQEEAQLEYIEDFYDFGTIKQGEVVNYTFRFSNTGNAPLQIYDIIAGCGCTKTNVSSKLLNPGQEATLEVVFNSKGWRGVQYKSATLRTNGVIREKSVTIKANVVN